MRTLSFPLLPLLVLCIAALTAAHRDVQLQYADEMVGPAPSRPPYTLHNRKLHISSTLDDSFANSVWLLGCIAGGTSSVEMTIAGQGPFMMQFDTGSSTLGVLSTLCHDDSECGSDLGSPLNVSEGVVNGRLQGPYGNVSVTFGDSGFSGPLYDGSVHLMGTAHSLDTVVRFAPVETAYSFLNSSWYCPFDSHTKQHDFAQGLVGAGLAGTLSGNGDTEWLLAYFDQHPKEAREFTYELCPMDAGRLWMGRYDGDEVFACSPNVGVTRWEVQTCGMTLTSHANHTTNVTVLGSWADFGVCGSHGDLEQCTLVDTGTLETLVPDPVYQNFVAALRSDPAYIAAFGSTGDPFDPAYAALSAPCATSAMSVHELRRQLPTVHFQLSNSSTVGGNGTCNANHSLAMPGVDGYLSRFTSPHGRHPLYCATLASSGGPPVPTQLAQFTLLGDSFMQTHIIKNVLNSTAEESLQICFAPGSGCAERREQDEQAIPHRLSDD